MARNVLIIGSGNKVSGDAENIAIINVQDETFDNTYSNKTVLQNKKVIISDTTIDAPTLVLTAAQDIRAIKIDSGDSPYTVVQLYNTIFVDATGGNVDITLADFSIPFTVIRTDSSANRIRVVPSDGPPNIDGQSYYDIVNKFDGATFYYKSGTWYSQKFKHDTRTKLITSNTSNDHIYDVYLGDATSGDITFTLNNYYKQVTVKKIDSSANKITLVPSSGNIEDSADYDLSIHKDFITVVFDGTNWWATSMG